MCLEACIQFSVLDVRGDLRAPVTTELRERVAAHLGHGERRIELDLAQLSSIDAAGLGELVHVLARTNAAGGVLRIARATRHVRRLLEATGLSTLLSDGNPRCRIPDPRMAGLPPTGG